MKTYKTVNTTTQQVDTVRCNKCGRTLRYVHDEPWVERDEWLTVTTVGGYYSTYPGDGNKVEFDLCDACLQAFVETFAIPVEPKDADIEYNLVH